MPSEAVYTFAKVGDSVPRRGAHPRGWGGGGLCQEGHPALKKSAKSNRPSCGSLMNKAAAERLIMDVCTRIS